MEANSAQQPDTAPPPARKPRTLLQHIRERAQATPAEDERGKGRNRPSGGGSETSAEERSFLEQEAPPRRAPGVSSLAVFLAATGAISWLGFRYGFKGSVRRFEEEEFKEELAKRRAKQRVARGRQIPKLPRAAPPAVAPKPAAGPAQVPAGRGIRVRPRPNPVAVAERALFVATVLSVSTFAIGTVTTAWYLDAYSLPEFAERMGEIVPRRAEQIRSVVLPPLEGLKGGLQSVFGRLKDHLPSTEPRREVQATREEAQFVDSLESMAPVANHVDVDPQSEGARAR